MSRDGDIFQLQSVSVTSLKASQLKRYVHNELAEIRNIVNRRMKVAQTNPIWRDLVQLHDRAKQDFMIKTIGFFKADSEEDQPLLPKHLYNLVLAGPSQWKLQGKEFLTWTPLHFIQ